MIVNKRFNTLKPFIHALIDECGEQISDYMFSIACEEFNISEDEAMERMFQSKEYDFVRLSEGWSANSTTKHST